MKLHSKKHWTLLALLFASVFCQTSALALKNPLAKKPGITIEVTAPFIELRTGPGRGYPVFHVAEKGENLRVFKRQTDWYKVETDKGLVGWVKNEELNDSLSADGTLAEFSKDGREEYIERKWELGMAAGDFSGSDSLTTYIGYHLTPNLSAELKYTQSFGDFSNTKLYSINAVHQTWPEWRVSPFFTLGAGVLQTTPIDELTREDSVLTVGGGIFIYASRNFLLRLEYNNHTVLTELPQNDEVDEWKAGFSVFF